MGFLALQERRTRKVAPGTIRYQSIQRSAAPRELHKDRGECSVAKHSGLSPAGSMNVCFWTVASFMTPISSSRTGTVFCSLGIVHTVCPVNGPFVVIFLDRVPVRTMLRPELNSTDPSAERFPWCLQYRKCSTVEMVFASRFGPDEVCPRVIHSFRSRSDHRCDDFGKRRVMRHAADIIGQLAIPFGPQFSCLHLLVYRSS